MLKATQLRGLVERWAWALAEEGLLFVMSA